MSGRAKRVHGFLRSDLVSIDRELPAEDAVLESEGIGIGGVTSSWRCDVNNGIRGW